MKQINLKHFVPFLARQILNDFSKFLCLSFNFYYIFPDFPGICVFNNRGNPDK